MCPRIEYIVSPSGTLNVHKHCTLAWRNGRLAANPKVVDLRVAGWSACLAVPKNGEPEGGGVVPMLGGPAEVSCEPSRTERVRD